VQRIVQVATASSVAIDRERVLDQVVGAIDRKSSRRTHRQGERRRRHLDHAADCYLAAMPATVAAKSSRP